MGKIINIGSLNLDHVYQVDHFVLPGETTSALSYAVNVGGKGLNQSIALAKAGAQVWHGGMLGTDGGMLSRALEEAGVDVSWLRALPESCGHAVIQVNSQGQNCILLHGGTNRMLTREYVDQLLACAQPEDVVLVQNETNLVDYIIERAAGLGLRVAMNAAPMGPEVCGYPLELLSWLVVNEVEGAQLTGVEDPTQVMERLTARYPNTAIVLTLGGDGVWYRDKDTQVRMGVCRIPHIVDTTAAGDTFLGYFLAGTVGGAAVEDALERATAASALAIGRAGAAESIPALEEVQAALADGICQVPRLEAPAF